MTRPDNEPFVGAPENNKPGIITILLSLLVLLAMLASLVWPLLQSNHRPQPTPTPGFLQEA